jgi:hypothetical protein
MSLPRRAFLLGVLAGCTRREAPAPAPSLAPPEHDLHDWSFSDQDALGGSTRALVLCPRTPGPHPILIALHGRGEAVRGAEAGARGWLGDYRAGNAIQALRRGRLTREDFQDLVAPERLDALNAQLQQRPYRGLLLVCPHAPDFQGPSRNEATDRYGSWLIRTLLPRLRASFSTGAVGIDGVSMGGRMALRIGLAWPNTFAAVGSLQAALRDDDLPSLTEQATAYLRARPAGQLRLLSSDGDHFRATIARAHQALSQAALPHEHREVVGPHNYLFNQGPGSIEMLAWHDRILHG